MFGAFGKLTQIQLLRLVLGDRGDGACIALAGSVPRRWDYGALMAFDLEGFRVRAGACVRAAGSR
jgi:hypothetical protein